MHHTRSVNWKINCHLWAFSMICICAECLCSLYVHVCVWLIFTHLLRATLTRVICASYKCNCFDFIKWNRWPFRSFMFLSIHLHFCVFACCQQTLSLIETCIMFFSSAHNAIIDIMLGIFWATFYTIQIKFIIGNLTSLDIFKCVSFIYCSHMVLLSILCRMIEKICFQWMDNKSTICLEIFQPKTKLKTILIIANGMSINR